MMELTVGKFKNGDIIYCAKYDVIMLVTNNLFGYIVQTSKGYDVGITSVVDEMFEKIGEL